MTVCQPYPIHIFPFTYIQARFMQAFGKQATGPFWWLHISMFTTCRNIEFRRPAPCGGKSHLWVISSSAIPNLKPWRTAKSAKNAKENQKTALYLVFLSALGELGGSMIFPMLKRRIIWRKGCLFQTSNFRFGIADRHQHKLRFFKNIDAVLFLRRWLE